MEVFAYGSDLSLTVNGRAEAACTADKVRETFVATRPLDITSTDPLTVNATLSRITSSLQGQLFTTGASSFMLDTDYDTVIYVNF